MKKYFVNNDGNSWTNNELARVTDRPSLIYGSAPEWELNFVVSNGVGGSIGVDLSDAIGWRAVVDSDFDHATSPMVVTESGDIDMTAVASGILRIPLDTDTQSFGEKIGTKTQLGAFLEIQGLDSNSKMIYCWQLPVTCLNSIDPPTNGGE